MNAPRGHRRVAHTADLILEAWGPTRTDCYEEAASALVSSCIDAVGAQAGETVQVALAPASDEELLVALLEEVVFLLDARGAVPVETSVVDRPGGGLIVRFRLASLDDGAVVGAAPKAVTRHELEVAREDDRWRCRFTVDV